MFVLGIFQVKKLTLTFAAGFDIQDTSPGGLSIWERASHLLETLRL